MLGSLINLQLQIDGVQLFLEKDDGLFFWKLGRCFAAAQPGKCRGQIVIEGFDANAPAFNESQVLEIIETLTRLEQNLLTVSRRDLAKADLDAIRSSSWSGRIDEHLVASPFIPLNIGEVSSRCAQLNDLRFEEIA